MELSHILDDLNDSQRQAVSAPPSNLLVLAGAGSGKTRVLVHRIAWLIQHEDYHPNSILSVTFTNKAAAEMKHRIEDLMHTSTGGMWVGTFHSIANRLLRRHWKEAGIAQDFRIIDSDDQLRLIKRVYTELEIDEGKWPYKQAQWFINGQKDEGRRAGHIQAPELDLYLRNMQRIYQAYENACERGGILDFAELLLRAHELWLNNPDLLHHYQQRFRHILVDEFQDTNTIQYAWLRVLSGDQVPMTIVGDDDQSIYGWRGAKIENIQKFKQDFKDPTMIKLEQNYRSTKRILDSANQLIAHNPDRLGKTLWTDGELGDPISLYAAYNEHDEARFIVDRIEEWASSGNSRIDAAILYRSNAQSRVLEEALVRASVPYRIYGGHRFYDRLEIKNALAYLRLLSNRDDDAAMDRVINTPTRGIGGKTLDMLRQHANEQNVSLWAAAKELLGSNSLTGRARTTLGGFFDLIQQLDSDTSDCDLFEQVDHIIQASGLLEHHAKEKGEAGEARVENLKELVNAAKQFETGTMPLSALQDQDADLELSPLSQFLDQAALDAGDLQADESHDYVRLMTLHSAKGLEFPLVFLSGMEEGIFPSRMSNEEPDRLHEERRLAYVGITRAMKKLYVSYAEVRRLYGSETYNKVSRFVRELPQEHLEELRPKAVLSMPVSTKPTLISSKSNIEIPDTGIRLGQRVRHKLFGEGVVLNYEGSGDQARVQINFENEGSKWLVVGYAKLEVL